MANLDRGINWKLTAFKELNILCKVVHSNSIKMCTYYNISPPLRSRSIYLLLGRRKLSSISKMYTYLIMFIQFLQFIKQARNF